ncbi:uncharacterized protein LOC118751109 [Rhagoletis pomonella]|uniref:uncharacterized protein LOC118751109 n=1 Tax=Rhagoletis pomonella TaxID=28610 RepID=UPI001783FC84|nr:uncharacterized protein LOC118751109 [Rhagoletis pomonella]
MKCAVISCGKTNNNKASECSFFRFPAEPNLARKLIKFCRRDKDFNPKTGYVCMDHFSSEDFENSLKYQMGFAKKRALKRDVPTIYKKQIENPERIERECAIKQRKQKGFVRNYTSKAQFLYEGEKACI